MKATPETKLIQTSPEKERGNLRVLVVDNEPKIRSLLTAMLQDINKDKVLVLPLIIEEAENGQEALDMINEESAEGRGFDVIFTDKTMPVMDGLSLNREIVKRRLKTKVCLITFEISPDEIPSYKKEEGFAEVLLKPVREADIFNFLQTVIADSNP